MANTHEVHIEGVMPFNVYEHEAATRWLGIMNSPSWGLRIEYGREHYEPAGRGRKAMYEFTISGREAIWETRIVEMCRSFVEAGGRITLASIADLDYPAPARSILGEFSQAEVS